MQDGAVGMSTGLIYTPGTWSSLEEIIELQKVAATEPTVLLLGESGTGKELFARAIHHISDRRDQPFIALNCAAIPENLVENELFGHEKGAFTGAGNRKVGKIELAQRGTLFLDEIGELPLASQAKLLRVLEERRFERVGGTQPIDVDVRIVTATNRDLEKRIREKLFREDLYFRISAVPITIPPLRDRGDDLDILADHFLERFCRDLGKSQLTLSQEARHRLREYSWPGNVRELQNAIERAVILADGSEITHELLVCKPASVNTENAPANLVPETFSWEGSFDEVTARAQLHVERVLLENALKDSRWNKTRAAEKLGITPKTLLAKMRATGLES